jgi:hypothetical protein
MLTLMVWSQADGLDWSYQSLVPRWHWTNYGRDKLWLVGCLGSESRLAQSQTGGMRLTSGALVKTPRLGHGSAGNLYPGVCLTTEEKSRKNLSQCSRKALGWSAPNAIRLVDLAIALDWPADPCRPWLSHQAKGSTLGQLKYTPSCRTRGFPKSANFESKLAVRALLWSANSGTHRSSCICLLLTYQGAQVARRRHLDC